MTSTPPSLRRTLLAIHRWGGLLAGIVLLVIALTGALMVYEKEIDRALHPDLWRMAPAESRLPLETLRAAAVAAQPGLDMRQIVVRAGAGQPVEFRFEKGRHAFVDPGSGRLLGTVHREGSFFDIVEHLHTSLAAGPVGKWIVTTSTLVLGSLLLTGILLWWPKQWRQLKGAVSLALGRRGRALHFNLHNTLGFWSAIPLLVMCVTGAVMAIKPIGRLLEGDAPRIRTVHPIAATDAGPPAPVDRILAAADSHFAGWRELRLHTPRRTHRITAKKAAAASGPAMAGPEGPQETGPEHALNFAAWRVEAVAGDAAHEHARSKAWFDPRTAALVATDHFEDRRLGAQIRALMRPIHDGSILGPITRFLALVGVLMLPILSITGYALWWLRVRAQKARARCVALGVVGSPLTVRAGRATAARSSCGS